MKKPFLIIPFIVLAIVLVGCERSATTATKELEPAKPSGHPTATSNPAQILIAQTQTQQAVLHPSATPTVEGAVPTEVPPTAVPATVEVTGSDIIATPEPGKVTEAPAIPTLVRPSSYTLKPGENPYCIARRYNMDIGELLSLNSLTTESQPVAGTVLSIPSGHKWSSGSRWLLPHPAQYAVRAGDTIYTVACLYGDVSPEAIIVVNKLTEPYELSAGLIIEIP